MQVLSLFYSMATSGSILLLTKPNTARHAEQPNTLPLKSPVLSSSCLVGSGWFCLVNANGGKHSEHTKEEECLCPAFFLPFTSQHFFGGWDVKHFPSVAWDAMGSWWLATLSAYGYIPEVEDAWAANLEAEQLQVINVSFCWRRNSHCKGEGEARQYRENSTGCPQSVKEREKIGRNKKTQIFLI